MNVVVIVVQIKQIRKEQSGKSLLETLAKTYKHLPSYRRAKYKLKP